MRKPIRTLATLLLLIGSVFAGSYRVHYSIKGSGRDITVQAESSPEARRTVTERFPDAVVTERGARSNRSPVLELNLPPGGLLAFDEKTGGFLREFSPPDNFAYNFHPRGLVIGPGPNGRLYVSNFPDLKKGTGGQVLVFDPETLNFVGTFISDEGGPGKLNRPEGLVFGPDGNLYITSFRANPSDTDSIRIYDGKTGAFIGKIDLDQPDPKVRAFAQALLFGPGGFLFVPISGGGPDTGAVRRYNISAKTFTNFVPPAAAGGPWYLTFGKTDPGTLQYNP